METKPQSEPVPAAVAKETQKEVVAEPPVKVLEQPKKIASEAPKARMPPQIKKEENKEVPAETSKPPMPAPVQSRVPLQTTAP